MTNQLLELPDLDEYAGLSAVDIAHAVINWPEGSEDQQRAIAALRQRAPGRGHNRSPLSEALDEELAARRTRADQLQASTIQTTIDLKDGGESAAKVIDLVRMWVELHDGLERDRKERTKPYRDATKLINDTYGVLALRCTLAIGGSTGRDGLNGMLTQWDDKERARVEADRRRLAEEARRREEEATAARAAAEAKAAAGKIDPAAELEALRAADQALQLARRAGAIRHEPTRSQLGQTTRRREIRFVIEDLSKRLRDILRSPRRNQVEAFVHDMTKHELRDLGVAAVEKGIDMPGVRAWVEEGGVSVRR